MLGDLNISEPGALIGFAGPRVIRETIGKDLPKGFQSAEFVLEHGFLDFITPRKELKDKINLFIKYPGTQPTATSADLKKLKSIKKSNLNPELLLLLCEYVGLGAAS